MDWSTPALRVSLSTEDSEPSLSGPREDRMGSSPECHLGTEAPVPKQMTAGKSFPEGRLWSHVWFLKSLNTSPKTLRNQDGGLRTPEPVNWCPEWSLNPTLLTSPTCKAPT